MTNWHQNGQTCSPLPSLPLVMDKLSSHLLCADTDTWQNCLVKINYQKIIKFLAELDFFSYILMNYFTVGSHKRWCWCKGSKSSWLKQVKKEWQKNFATSSGNWPLDQPSCAFKLHLSGQTEDTKVFHKVRLKNICNIGIYNEMIFEVQQVPLLPCNTKRTLLLVVILGKYFSL